MLALSALFAAFTAAAPLSAEVLFRDDFESGGLAKWSQAHAYYITDDPLQAGDRVLSSPGGASRTTLARTTSATGAIAKYAGGLNFTYQVYTGEAQADWQAKAIFGTAGGVNAPGYGFVVGATSISIRRVDGGYGGWVQNQNTVTLANRSLTSAPLAANQWNTVSFDWLEDGTLALKLNGTLVLTATDTTYAPKTGRIDLENFLSNSVADPDRVLLFDDITLSSVAPAPASAPRM